MRTEQNAELQTYNIYLHVCATFLFSQHMKAPPVLEQLVVLHDDFVGTQVLYTSFEEHKTSGDVGETINININFPASRAIRNVVDPKF